MARKSQPVATARRVATLNASGVLIGEEFTTDPDDKRPDPGDLPLDGRYKWDTERGTFIPLGHGFGKVKQLNPYSNEHIMALLIEHLEALSPETKLPPAVEQWKVWYDTHIRRREEELGSIHR